LWFLALTLATATSLPTATDAQTPASAPADTPAPAAGEPQDTEGAFRYRVTIVAPPEVEAPVRSSVDVVRWQDFADMTAGLFDWLARDAPAQAREAAATQGFFNAEVDLAVDRATTPATITLTITPGPPTRITSVEIDVTGPARDTPPGPAVLARIRDEWLLPVDATFRQRLWTGAKTRAVNTLAASPFAAATLAASEARVDPAVQGAKLSVTLASGPAFHFGSIDVKGLEKYTPGLVRNFSNFQAGDIYSLETLDDYVRRLLASGYFASVQAAIATDPAQADAAPVTLSVIEAPSRRVEFGVGYSTDTEFRVTGAYSDLNLDGKGLQFYADARIETKEQSANLRFVRPPTSSGWIDTYATGFEQTDIENLETRTAFVSVRRRAIEERRTPAFGMGYYIDEQTPQGQPTARSHALYVDGEYTWRDVDDLLQPTRGWMANVQLGVGVPGASTEQFGRVIGRLAAWWPLSRQNGLNARFDIGAVIADSRVGIPSVFLFRTGGDTTVRGYAFESLGVQQGDAVVGGRYYAVASVEAVHWITESIGLAAFVDAGNAVDDLNDLDIAVGYGVGGRLRTPVGPFRLDVAYGERTGDVRLHFSVGLSF
jgi:translocation and assembly module TamA